MKKLTDKEVKQIELDILEYVHNFCEENGLKYIMNYGTLIGAVRHKGFIPWDDDIDISMPRADYEKLIASFPKNGRYKILDHRTSKDYFNNFVKVIDTNTKIVDNRNDKTYESGLFIDIFPMDRFDDMKAVDKTYNLVLGLYCAGAHQPGEAETARVRSIGAACKRSIEADGYSVPNGYFGEDEAQPHAAQFERQGT